MVNKKVKFPAWMANDDMYVDMFTAETDSWLTFQWKFDQTDRATAV